MSFAAGLRQVLDVREGLAASELQRGDSLRDILSRHLLAVEEAAETELLTSVLLLSTDGKRLAHGAAPNLPTSYCEAIDGSAIGPSAGSCGTAAYFGCPVYVSDIATDPLWTHYRDVALPHGLRSCWSTPIRDDDGNVIGTFAIYHRSATSPTIAELDAIDMITDHVAQAIMAARSVQLEKPNVAGVGRRDHLRLAIDNPFDLSTDTRAYRDLLIQLSRLEVLAATIRQRASSKDPDVKATIEALWEHSRKLNDAARRHIPATFPTADPRS